MNTHDFYYMQIPVEKLKVDNYQRPVNPSRIKKIVDNFNMDLFNAPKVSRRPDGFFYIFDGQHSVVAHRKFFGDDIPINCKVYEGLSRSEEIELFVQQNGFSRDVCTNDKLKAMYDDPNSDVREMVEATAIAGAKIDFLHGNYTDHISATSAAYKVWQLVGRDNYINIISVIRSAWDGDEQSYTAGFLKGLAVVYKKHSDKIKNDALITALKRRTADYYIREARDMKGTMANRYARLFIDAYNYKKTAHRLENV